MTVRSVTDGTCDLPSHVIAEGQIAVVPIRIQGEVAPVIGASVEPGAVGPVCTQASPLI